jgi:hypothetical protein
MDSQDFLRLCVSGRLAVLLTVIVVRLGSLDHAMLSLVVTLKPVFLTSKAAAPAITS